MSKFHLIIFIGLMILVSPAIADTPVWVNGSWHHGHSVVEEGSITTYTTGTIENGSFVGIKIDPTLFVTPITAPTAITYSQEYYILKEKQNVPWGKVSGIYSGLGREYPTIALLQYYETQRQTIVMEKQNELLAEQNGLLKIITTGRLVCTKPMFWGCAESVWETG